MYNFGINELLIRRQGDESLADWESQYLDAALSPKEQEDLGALATKLRSAEFLEELVDTCDYDVDTFAEVYHIDHDTVARWMEGNMTSFERRALEFMLLHEAYDENRVHCCPICGRIHFKICAAATSLPTRAVIYACMCRVERVGSRNGSEFPMAPRNLCGGISRRFLQRNGFFREKCSKTT